MYLRRDMPWRWITVLAVIGVAFQLGYRGFQERLAAAGHEKSSRDVAYLTVQLFFLESGAVDGAVGWKLEVARFLAPLTTAYVPVQAGLEF